MRARATRRADHSHPFLRRVPDRPSSRPARRAIVDPKPFGRDIAVDGVGGARMLVSDVRVALLLMDEARYRAVKRLFGVSRDQSSAVTLIALAVLAQAAHEKSDQMLRGPGGPTRSDVALGAAALRELVWIPGPPSRDVASIGTLMLIAMAGALVRLGLSRAAHGIRASSHRIRQSFNHRYGPLSPSEASNAGVEEADKTTGAVRVD